MINFSHEEALLFRLLTSFFGKDRVVPNMSVLSVCGGRLPEKISELQKKNSTAGSDELGNWARSNKCLFTVVDREDVPKLVIEFFSGFENSVDLQEEQHQRVLRPILSAAGIKYVTISNDEFSDIMNPQGNLDFFSFLKAQYEPSESSY